MIWHVALGPIGYAEAVELQYRLHDAIVAGAIPEVLLTLEHHPVLTLGANFHDENLLVPRAQIEAMGVEVAKTDRGGDVTYHGPGQIVAYPLLHLKRVNQDLHAWLRTLEEWVIQSLNAWDLLGYRFPPHTGVWVNERKVCAIGVKVRKWVSLHGIAMNCLPDLNGFDLIVPCGIRDHGVTSISRERGIETSVADAEALLVRQAQVLFNDTIKTLSRDELFDHLNRLEQHGDRQQSR